jgi:hypothetical protein
MTARHWWMGVARAASSNQYCEIDLDSRRSTLYRAGCVLSIRRPLSALFALLYLLLAAGGEALQHGKNPAAAAYAESHLHAPGDSNHDCPPPPHDEDHCPACKLTGLRILLTEASHGELAGDGTPRRPPPAGHALAPALRSHAPPNLRAPPLG